MKMQMSVGQVSEVVEMSPSTVKRWADLGLLRFHMTPGGHRRFDLADVMAFNAKLKTGGFDIKKEAK